ncbi:hypothetical protein GCM10011297_33880 [Bacterioplanes sanyensis]|uniref:DUF7691 family protein n=1 Tax=Bacterioplanes sanyensis TaxID=1249553 RepID=UPI00167C2DAC|nr:hypothetical protein [Bacterioplanes sanyensis]GGY58406.1 hypothetical protein GCM10011297_33880 [Bacterioplanes sanyensis]
MSYGWQAYAVDLDALNQCYGQLTGEQLTQFKQQQGSALARLTAEFGTSAEQALQHIAAGALDDDVEPALYWYVWELLAQSMGTALDNSEFYPAEMTAITGLKGLKSLAFSHPWLEDAGGFPMVFACLIAQHAECAASVSASELSVAQQQQLQGWLNTAAGRDLVLFYY